MGGARFRTNLQGTAYVLRVHIRPGSILAPLALEFDLVRTGVPLQWRWRGAAKPSDALAMRSPRVQGGTRVTGPSSAPVKASLARVSVAERCAYAAQGMLHFGDCAALVPSVARGNLLRP
eukprot:6182021-Pleurochrysis_carterae.AAC.2